ncbi:hypothetical protein [Gilvimarinus polysaccharolyticus]|uniref:hypothetical protein n=1 Tax=Gilvimarinus polysaccharolyticus TaxID=863921 RepID=UPI00067333D4|nr:hypothetical protein [Gilvimarinus polysaccharolyticus]
MKTIKYISIAALMALPVTSALAADKAVFISDDIPFSSDLDVRKEIRDECQLGTKMSGFLQTYVGKRGYTVTTYTQGEAAPKGLVLNVEIDNVQAPGGGAWSGSKSVGASGTLTDNGKEIGSFRGQRTTSGGAFGAFKGTCSFLGRDVKSLAADISKWMVDPKPNARLGELR